MYKIFDFKYAICNNVIFIFLDGLTRKQSQSQVCLFYLK